jgi:hypothetical protein
MYHQLTEAERYTLSVLKREGRLLCRMPWHWAAAPARSAVGSGNATLHQSKPWPLYVPRKAQEQANGQRRRRRVKQ